MSLDLSFMAKPFGTLFSFFLIVCGFVLLLGMLMAILKRNKTDLLPNGYLYKKQTILNYY